MQNLTIIIPFFNGHKTIQRLLDGLPHNLPVIVVDDHSDNEAATVVYSTDCDGRPIRVIRPEKKGYFTGAVNRGIEHCNTDVLILNQDVYFTGGGWLGALAQNQYEYDLIGEGIQGKHPYWPMGYIHGTFMYISRRVIDKIGLLNEVDYPLWGSTCEYQLRACRAGFKALPLATVPDFVHTRQGKFGESIQTILQREPEKQALFVDIPPKISVVTAAHNYGRFLPDLVNSLIGGPTSLGQMSGQTFQSFELVIVDYGSTDDTPKIAKSLVSDWQAIRYIRTNDNGGAAAINTAIQAAYGEYIAVIDADDMMESFRLEMLYRLQLDNPHSFVYDDLLLFANGERRVYGLVRPGRWDTVYPLGFKDSAGNAVDYDFEQLLKRNGISKAIMFPKVAWKEAGGYPESMKYGREDWAFNVALGLKGWCGVKAERAGYLYRREGHNRTLTNTSPEWRKKFMGQMLALYPEVYRGYRPMGCCGNKSTPKNGGGGGSRMAAAIVLPGAEEGWELLEYIGSNWGTQTYYGPVSRKKYTFGKSEMDRIKPVIKTDAYGQGKARGMLSLQEDGKPVFKVYQRPEAPVLEMANVSEGLEAGVADQLAATPETLAVMAEQVTESLSLTLPFDPSGFSVNALKGRLNSLNEEELEALLEAEKAGLNRKGAINAIGEVLNG